MEFPEITSNYIYSAVQTGRVCQASKVQRYYNKLVGGVSCSNIEQLKITLLVYILEQVYKLDMTCFNDLPANSQYSYIRLFINYLNVECADCGITFSGFNSSASESTVIGGGGGTGTDPAEEEEIINEVEGDGVNDELNYILLEDGTYILLENDNGAHLMENN